MALKMGQITGGQELIQEVKDIAEEIKQIKQELQQIKENINTNNNNE